MMNVESVCRAFTDELPNHLILLTKRVVDTISILVLEEESQTAGVAQFTAGPPEYVGLLLSNGGQYWQNEWSDEYQKEYARDYARFVTEYIDSGRTRVHFTADDEDIYPNTRARAWELSEGLDRTSYV